VKWIFEEAEEAYFRSVNHLALGAEAKHQGPRFVYTPMHGVGLPFMSRAVDLFPAYCESMYIVGQQAVADPEFPTVPFPNPEENGALDLAKQTADENSISFIIANDPDADRFAFAEKFDKAGWHQLTGNQIGVLLASYVFETHPGNKSKLAMLASTVSSRMLARMAQEAGFIFQETLTGFKWLGNVAQDLQRQGYEPVYAYEEAIGYMFPSVVWDKDGIATATVFLKALLQWKAQGLTPWSKLQQLYEMYGYFEDANTYLISPSPDTTNKVFQDIRELNNGSRPTSIGDRSIRRWRDLTLGYDSATADGKPDLPVDASAQMITCELDDVVFTARGSGTEPKIKLYIEAMAESSDAANTLADDVLQSLLKEWFKPEYGLKLAGT
jgi:phosphoglucomutase